jgi:hypothetical protein
MLLGGGLDMKINKRVTFRPIGADWYMTRLPIIGVIGIAVAGAFDSRTVPLKTRANAVGQFLFFVKVPGDPSDVKIGWWSAIGIQPENQFP